MTRSEGIPPTLPLSVSFPFFPDFCRYVSVFIFLSPPSYSVLFHSKKNTVNPTSATFPLYSVFFPSYSVPFRSKKDTVNPTSATSPPYSVLFPSSSVLFRSATPLPTHATKKKKKRKKKITVSSFSVSVSVSFRSDSTKRHNTFYLVPPISAVRLFRRSCFRSAAVYISVPPTTPLYSAFCSVFPPIPACIPPHSCRFRLFSVHFLTCSVLSPHLFFALIK